MFMTSVVTFRRKLKCFVLYLCHGKRQHKQHFNFIQKDWISVNAKIREPFADMENYKSMIRHIEASSMLIMEQ